MAEKRKLIFVNTHPVQYYAPLYKQIAADNFFDLEVWYCTRHGLQGELDKEFNTPVKWDTPVLDGYKYKFLKNRALKPGLYSGFWGVVNPSILTELKQLPKNSIIVSNAWNPFSNLYTILCSKILGHKTCLRAEPPLVHEFGRSGMMTAIRKLLLGRLLFRFVDVFLYIGTQNKKFYEYFGVDTSKLYFSPYSVNNVFFTEQASILLPRKLELRRKLNIPEGNRVVLYSGKLIPKKRPLDLLLVFKRILDHKNYSLVFMGDGELRSDLEKVMRDHDIGNTIITGFINQSKISEYYAMADIFVMCSDVGETWGLSTNEAMNFGLPLIISDRTGNYEDLVDQNGYVIKCGDLEDFTDKLEKLLTETKEELAIKGNRSRELVAKFSYETVIENLKKIS